MAVTPCDGLTVTLHLNLAVTSAPDRHYPVTSKPSHPVTPVTGSGESVSPSRNGFFQTSLPLSPPAETRPEHVAKEAWPINRSKEEKERVEEFRQALVIQKHFVICILASIWFKSVTKGTLLHCNINSIIITFQFNWFSTVLCELLLFFFFISLLLHNSSVALVYFNSNLELLLLLPYLCWFLGP